MNLWSGLIDRPPRLNRPAAFAHQSMPKFSTGDKVGEWELLEFQPGRKQPDRVCPRWLCRCSCGTERSVLSHNLTSGQSKSCGHDGNRWPASYQPVTR